jgi:hypothetical protein
MYIFNNHLAKIKLASQSEFYLCNFNTLYHFGHSLGTKFCMEQYAMKYSNKYSQPSPLRPRCTNALAFQSRHSCPAERQTVRHVYVEHIATCINFSTRPTSRMLRDPSRFRLYAYSASTSAAQPPVHAVL